MPIIRVALDVPLHRQFDYLAPDATPGDVGRRVRVPFGRRPRIGVITAVLEAGELPPEQLKPVEEILPYTVNPEFMIPGVPVVALEGDPVLFNQYGVMAVNPEKHKQVKYKEAMQFIDWLISPEGQQAIAAFKDKHGNQLFVPNAK